MLKLKKFLFLFFLFLFCLYVVNGEDEKYVGDYTYHEYQHAFGTSSIHANPSDSSSSSGGGGDGMLGLSALFGGGNQQQSYSGNNNYYGYNNGYGGTPMYGNAQYTYGPVNGIQRVNNGYIYGTSYDAYSAKYWTCVNNYRGQYYYSYTYGHYVCDTRANRYG